MMKQKITAKILSLLLLLALLLPALVGCGIIEVTKEEYVAPLLAENEDLPAFDEVKFRRVESTFRRYTIFELPAREELAKSTAEQFDAIYRASIDLTDKSAVTDALLDSFVSVAGDRYAYFRSPTQYESYTEDMSGKFYGIGVVVSANAEVMRVTLVYENSPAEEAGFRIGDVISAVEGESYATLGRQGTINKIRGEKGTPVRVTVLRDGEPLELTAIRAEVEEKTVNYRVEDGIGYVTMTGFKSNTATQFRDMIDDLERQGVRGIIFDERSNPGGYVTAVTSALSYLVPKGTPTFFSRGNTEMALTATDDHVLSVPCVVLCGPDTASAGELFTAAIRDYRDMGLLSAIIVGETTYKKGVMQNTYTFTDGSALTMTVSFYDPPSGVNYDGVGVVPDEGYAVENSGEDDAQMEAAKAALEKLLDKS